MQEAVTVFGPGDSDFRIVWEKSLFPFLKRDTLKKNRLDTCCQELSEILNRFNSFI